MQTLQWNAERTVTGRERQDVVEAFYGGGNFLFGVLHGVDFNVQNRVVSVRSEANRSEAKINAAKFVIIA
jgi:hypothetical protein